MPQTPPPFPSPQNKLTKKIGPIHRFILSTQSIVSLVCWPQFPGTALGSCSLHRGEQPLASLPAPRSLWQLQRSGSCRPWAEALSRQKLMASWELGRLKLGREKYHFTENSSFIHYYGGASGQASRNYLPRPFRQADIT